MIKLKNILSESSVWDRKFGEPLPTLTDVMNKKEDCECGGDCCSVTEGPDEQRPADQEVQRIVKAEAKLRERMFKLEQIFLRDARPENVKLAKDIKKVYKDTVTKFMREMIKLRKKMK